MLGKIWGNQLSLRGEWINHLRELMAVKTIWCLLEKTIAGNHLWIGLYLGDKSIFFTNQLGHFSHVRCAPFLGGHLPQDGTFYVPKSRDETRFPLDKATNLEGVQWKNTCLVSGFNHLEKYEFVNGKDEIPYMKWKIIHSCLKPPTRCLFPFQAIVSHAARSSWCQGAELRWLPRPCIFTIFWWYFCCIPSGYLT
jgi:hypothetical protein